MKKILSVLMALGLSSVVLGATTDNEIFLEQVGDTLTLTIDQIGYGNKFGGTIVSGAVATDMLITGSAITFNLDQIGNSNQLFGPITLDSSAIDMEFTGDSNIFDWAIGATGSADSLDLHLDVVHAIMNFVELYQCIYANIGGKLFNLFKNMLFNTV